MRKSEERVRDKKNAAWLHWELLTTKSDEVGNSGYSGEVFQAWWVKQSSQSAGRRQTGPLYIHRPEQILHLGKKKGKELLEVKGPKNTKKKAGM